MSPRTASILDSSLGLSDVSRPSGRAEGGLRSPPFFRPYDPHGHTFTPTSRTRLAGPLPEVELLACERVAAERLRLTIDHPDGVTLALCERVTKELRDLLVDYALEVSSPGPERPLTKPDHFRRFLGSPGARAHARAARRATRASPASSSEPPTRRSPWRPTRASCRSRTRRSAAATFCSEEEGTDEQGDRRRHPRARAGEGNLRRHAHGRPGGRPALGVQEEPRLGQVRPRGHRPRHAATSRSSSCCCPPELEEQLLAEAEEAAGGAHGRPRDGRAARARGARARPGEAGRSTATRSTSAT